MNSRNLKEKNGKTDRLRDETGTMTLAALCAEIERSWYQSRNASIVDNLAAEYPEYSSELYEFLTLLVATEIEPTETEETGSSTDAAQAWLKDEGFDLIRRIAAKERNQTPTTTPTTNSPNRPQLRPVRTNPRALSVASKARYGPPGHNEHFNEAVVIGVLVKQFGRDDFPLGRKRRTKFAYLLHRHCEGEIVGFEKKAAGPYNPTVRYGGAEKIAKNNGYVREHQSGKHKGLVAGAKITEAEAYFTKWYGTDPITWLSQFRFKSNDELELLTTVDMAIVELRGKSGDASAQTVKAVIADHPEWSPKLKREIFSDENIVAAIEESQKLFG